MDLLETARKEAVRRRIAEVACPPEDFSTPYNWKAGLLGGASLGSLGALAGSSVGVAALGGAVSGAWVLAPILGAAGLMAGKSFDK